MTNQIRRRVLASMPPKLRLLLDELEAAGPQIDFGKMPRDASASFGDGRAMCSLTDCSAHIELRNVSTIDYQIVAHEMLHVRRWWLEGSALVGLEVRVDHFDQMVARINNAFEHLIISPREAEWFGFPADRWDDYMRLAISRYRTPRPLIAERVQTIIDYLHCRYVRQPFFEELHAAIAAGTDGALLAELDQWAAAALYDLNQTDHARAVINAAMHAGVHGTFHIKYFDVAKGAVTHAGFGPTDASVLGG